MYFDYKMYAIGNYTKVINIKQSVHTHALMYWKVVGDLCDWLAVAKSKKIKIAIYFLKNKTQSAIMRNQ